MASNQNKVAQAAFIGIEFTSPVLGGVILGHYLDEYFKTAPYLTLILFLAGVFVGLYRLVTVLSAWQKRNSRET